MSFHPLSVVKTREALRGNTISSLDEARYWGVSSVVWLFYVYHSAWVGTRLSWHLVFEIAVAIGILWIGLSEAWKANGGSIGTDFLRRMVLIGSPLGVSVLALSQALFWISWFVFPMIIDGTSFRNPEFAWQVITFFLFNGIQTWFWWRTCTHLKVLNRAKDVKTL